MSIEMRYLNVMIYYLEWYSEKEKRKKQDKILNFPSEIETFLKENA